MTKKSVCVWCHSIIDVPDHYDDLQHKAVCSRGCRDAEQLFTAIYSDEEINRREHYAYLTRGEDYDGED